MQKSLTKAGATDATLAPPLSTTRVSQFHISKTILFIHVSATIPNNTLKTIDEEGTSHFSVSS